MCIMLMFFFFQMDPHRKTRHWGVKGIFSLSGYNNPRDHGHVPKQLEAEKLANMIEGLMAYLEKV